MSAIDPWARAVIDEHYRAKALSKTLPNLFGDASELPARFVESLEALAIEESKTEIEFAEARRRRDRQQQRQ